MNPSLNIAKIIETQPSEFFDIGAEREKSHGISVLEDLIHDIDNDMTW